MAFLQYVMQILFSVMMAVIMFVMVPRAAASAERIQEVLDTEVSARRPGGRPVRDRAGRPRPGRVPRRRRSATRAPRTPVLRAISFAAEPGRDDRDRRQHRQRQVDPDQPHPALLRRDRRARSTVDGVDVRAMRQEDLWRPIGVIPQQAFLFSGTVASNLRYGAPDATDDELWHALEIAQAREFVEEMPGGLEAPITQGGTNVSGGQRQRLAIARALVRAAGDLHLRRQLLGARLQDRLAAPGRAPRGDPVGDRDHRRPAGRHDHARRPDRGHGRRRDRRRSGPTPS